MTTASLYSEHLWARKGIFPNAYNQWRILLHRIRHFSILNEHINLFLIHFADILSSHIVTANIHSKLLFAHSISHSQLNHIRLWLKGQSQLPMSLHILLGIVHSFFLIVTTHSLSKCTQKLFRFISLCHPDHRGTDTAS